MRTWKTERILNDAISSMLIRLGWWIMDDGLDLDDDEWMNDWLIDWLKEWRKEGMNEWWWTSFQMITVVEWIGTLRYQLWCHCKTQLRFDAVVTSFNWSLVKKWAMYWQRSDTKTSRRGENRASGCERFEKNVVFTKAKLLIYSRISD
jgi:hypothetical protein